MPFHLLILVDHALILVNHALGMPFCFLISVDHALISVNHASKIPDCFLQKLDHFVLSVNRASKIEDERLELQTLMQIYQEGLLRKATALSEAVKRGLIEARTYAKIAKKVNLSNRQDAKKPRIRRLCVSPRSFKLVFHHSRFYQESEKNLKPFLTGKNGLEILLMN
ncbi:hypothetical protein B4U84_13925 [Westiellopsis prolifica IICB1]|nr:hypothetical protein B4U84_13925 [Westiellopsis prolifica IICB1]